MLPPLDPDDCEDMTMETLDRKMLRQLRRRQPMVKTESQLGQERANLYEDETLQTVARMTHEEWAVIREENSQLRTKLHLGAKQNTTG